MSMFPNGMSYAEAMKAADSLLPQTMSALGVPAWVGENPTAVSASRVRAEADSTLAQARKLTVFPPFPTYGTDAIRKSLRNCIITYDEAGNTVPKPSELTGELFTEKQKAYIARELCGRADSLRLTPGKICYAPEPEPMTATKLREQEAAFIAQHASDMREAVEAACFGPSILDRLHQIVEQPLVRESDRAGVAAAADAPTVECDFKGHRLVARGQTITHTPLPTAKPAISGLGTMASSDYRLGRFNP